jgi:DNA-binding transcriptional regulator/RsmH inhibitor MraZ
MALTDEQKSAIADFKTKIETWKSDELKKIDEKFAFLSSIKPRSSALSTALTTEAVDSALASLSELQEMTGVAYDEAT